MLTLNRWGFKIASPSKRNNPAIMPNQTKGKTS
ncbi:hypothetical protein [Salmonella phage NINP13076]|nr:hypothetical protein [Salmonella phage NINP13076]